MPSNPQTLFKTHILTLTSPNLETKLLKIQHLARQVFEPDTPESNYESQPTAAWQLQIATWKERLALGQGSALIYITRDEATLSDGTATAATELQPETPAVSTREEDISVVAFFFAHLRTLSHYQAAVLRTNKVNIDAIKAIAGNGPETEHEVTSYHIFLAAVHPSMRGRGLFSMLLDATKDRAREYGFGLLTVATIPTRFQGMFSILSREGSGWVVLEWKEAASSVERGGKGGEEGQKKVLMAMDLRIVN